MNDFFKTDSITLYHGDCLELMGRIPDKSISAVICDLPFGTTVCDWDVIIPFDKLWEQYNRVIKDNGAIVLFGKEPFSSSLRLSNLNMWKYDWVWLKNTKSNFMQALYQPLNNLEIISVFSKAYARNIKNKTTMLYNPQYTDGQPYKIPKESRTTYIFSINHKNGMYRHKDRDTSKRYPFSILKFNSVKSKERKHPTEKPVDLLRYLIRTYSNEGDTILDNTMGSGSTGVAAVMENRKFVGIEKDDSFFDIAQKRINEAIIKKSSEIQFETNT